MRPGPPPSQRGFTIIELMTTVIVLAVLTTIVGPQIREFLVNSTVTANANDLVVSLNLARAEAVKRGRVVEVIPTPTWDQGWEIRAQDQDGNFGTISTHDPLKEGYTLRAAMSGGSGNANRVAFRGDGGLTEGTAFNFSVCRPAYVASVTKSRRVTVAASGTVTSRRDTTGAPSGACS